MKSTGKRQMSWGLIIFCFIIFWPLGLILLFKRVSDDKSATMKNGQTVARISYILVAVGALYLLMAISNASPYYYAAAAALVGGSIWVKYVSKKMIATGERYKKYIEIIVNQNQTLIDSIASAVGVPYNDAVIDLQKMIDAGYFAGAYIDAVERVIVLTQPAHQPVSVSYETQPQERVVTCGSCGANNKITVGQVGECEYCGSHIM